MSSLPRLKISQCSTDGNILPQGFVIGYLLHFVFLIYLVVFALWHNFGIKQEFISRAMKVQVLKLRQEMVENGVPAQSYMFKSA